MPKFKMIAPLGVWRCMREISMYGMAYLKAATAMTLGVYTLRSFVDCNRFQMGCFAVATFLLTSASCGVLCNSRASCLLGKRVTNGRYTDPVQSSPVQCDVNWTLAGQHAAVAAAVTAGLYTVYMCPWGAVRSRHVRFQPQYLTVRAFVVGAAADTQMHLG